MTTLRTFRVPLSVSGTESDIELGRQMIQAWQSDGIFQIATDAAQDRATVCAFMDELGRIGEKILTLTALGLGLPADTLTSLTVDGWHHMRVLRFPAASAQTSRGIGAHTDYGLFVTPEPGVLTVFPGDILQFLTDVRPVDEPCAERVTTRRILEEDLLSVLHSMIEASRITMSACAR